MSFESFNFLDRIKDLIGIGKDSKEEEKKDNIRVETFVEKINFLNSFFQQGGYIESSELYQRFNQLFEKNKIPFPSISDIGKAINDSGISVLNAKIVCVNLKTDKNGENILSITHYFRGDNYTLDLFFDGDKWIIYENDENIQIREAVINSVFQDLKNHEGKNGDETGIATTLKHGLTVERYNLIKKETGNENITHNDAIKYYLGQLYDIGMKKDGFANSSSRLREVLLDSAYNLGDGVFKYSGLSNSLSRLTEIDTGNLNEIGELEADVVIVGLLDTASINGQGSLGIAKRRAIVYNKVAPQYKQILKVEISRGEIIYWGEGEKRIFSYFPENGIHISSSRDKVYNLFM